MSHNRKHLGHNLSILAPDQIIDRLVWYASLAPSSHNTQPWLFKIKDKTISLFANKTRWLKSSDKLERQLFISLGTAFENLTTAAKSFGLSFIESPFAEQTELNLIKSISISEIKIKNIDEETLNALISRHNNRSNFKQSSLPNKFTDFIKSLSTTNITITLITTQELKKQIQTIVEDATEKAFKDKYFTNELSKWIKPSLKKYYDGMPGYNIGTPWLISLLIPHAIRYLPLAKMQTSMVKEMLTHAPAYMLISSTHNEPKSWFEIGRLFEKIWLEAEKFNIKIGVLAAPIEIDGYERKIQQALEITNHPQIFFRIGFSDQIPVPSPRLNLKEIIIS
ncbi:MAG: hypothetical protein WC794_04400 [Candidatus Doudnabacteria bacterium]|jgi:hypothetical protein